MFIASQEVALNDISAPSWKSSLKTFIITERNRTLKWRNVGSFTITISYNNFFNALKGNPHGVSSIKYQTNNR